MVISSGMLTGVNGRKEEEAGSGGKSGSTTAMGRAGLKVTSRVAGEGEALVKEDRHRVEPMNLDLLSRFLFFF
jgi:hypothetical protein